MAKMKSSLLNMVLSLSIITLVAASLLAGAYTLTKDTIAATEAKNIAEAKLAVLPQLDGIEVAAEGTIAGDNTTIYPATLNGEPFGAAVEVLGSGFGGEFKIMVGIVADTIAGFKVLAHQETPGLGAKMGDWFATDKGNQRLAGHNPSNLVVVKKGETAADGKQPLDAITAATISSRAFLATVQAAYAAYKGGCVEATSGATKLCPNACQSDSLAPDSILLAGDSALAETAQLDNNTNVQSVNVEEK